MNSRNHVPRVYGGRLRAVRALLLVSAVVLAFPIHAAPLQQPLRFARIEGIPDQYVGGEILKSVYGRLHIPIELIDMPARRALLDSSRGELDGEVQRNPNVARQYPTLIMLRPAINYIEPSVFSRRAQFNVNGWDSVKAYRIGIVHGVGSSEDGTRGMKEVLAVATLDQLMLALAADRIDVAISDRLSGQAVIARLKLQGQLSLLKPRLQKIDIHHFLHEKHRDLVPAVEKTLEEMRADGELERLRERAIEQYLARLGAVPTGK